MRRGTKDLKLKRKVERSASSKFTVLFLISGVLSLVFSIYLGSQILALIGLGLVFWGVLFILLKPVNFVEGSLLYNVAPSVYGNDRRKYQILDF